MNERLILRGYRYSVYNRIARIALSEKGVQCAAEEIDPFQPHIPKDYKLRHPFGRVPVLSHDAFDIYETTAICRYVDAAFDGPKLLPKDAKGLARVAQVVSIVDDYGYRPMIRQVFAHRVFRPLEAESADEGEIAAGLEASLAVLSALDALASEGRVLDGEIFTLADCHLAPMIAYFAKAPEGAAALASHPSLAQWWAVVSRRQSVIDTDPGLP
ncbi:MAG: glutathione S-transferase family protein [Pseudomonadota bacterium]